jgi:hypothetical protein
MLSDKFFSPDDLNRITESGRKWKRLSFIAIPLIICIDFGVAFIASIKVSELFWPVAIFSLALGLLACYFVFYKRLKAFTKDIEEQIKVVGTLTVKSKLEKDKQQLINFESDGLKSIVVKDEIYNSVTVGDNLDVEFSKNVQYIFKVSKDGAVLISGN